MKRIGVWFGNMAPAEQGFVVGLLTMLAAAPIAALVIWVLL